MKFAQIKTVNQYYTRKTVNQYYTRQKEILIFQMDISPGWVTLKVHSFLFFLKKLYLSFNTFC